jgi:transcriptional regulator with XRE-family HTH domain
VTGEELRQARINKRLTQQKLGEMLGYKGRTGESLVQHWEADRREIPLKHIRKLSEILEIPLERFIP